MIQLFNIIIIQSFEVNKQHRMDKSFNFFKTKAKKQNQRPRNNSNKSNSSKANSAKQSNKSKMVTKQPTMSLTKKQKQIRDAIDSRYQKSKLRGYVFTRRNELSHRRSISSHSSEYEQYKKLKKMNVVDLKQYHKQQQSCTIESNNSSQQKKKFNLKFKLRDKNTSSNIIKTEGNEGDFRNASTKEMKTMTPSKLAKKADEWKFISIELKDDLSKPKNRKTQVKINSHRSYNVQQKPLKIKPNHSMNKYLDKAGKIKSFNGQKITKTRF